MGMEFINAELNLFGAKSAFEVLSWIAGLFAAVIAAMALRQRARQSRASLLLQLYERWEAISESRREVSKVYSEVVSETLQKNSDLEDKHRLEQLRKACKIRVDDTKKQNFELYLNFVSYLSFFETIGLFVRNRYVPFRDMLQMFKGPILNIDIIFSDHIADWQKHANVPDGLFANALYIARRARRRERIVRALKFWKR